jgi:4-azaleucine resistance transporter AzlC
MGESGASEAGSGARGVRAMIGLLDRRTLQDIGLVVVADAIVGLSFGAIAVGGGMPVWVPIAMSLLVFAGGSQFAALGILLAGGDPAAAVAAGLVLNARLLAFGFAAADALGPGWWRRLLGAQIITDESTAFTLSSDDPERRRALFWVSGVALFIAWNVAVALGALLGTVVGDTDALGLDAAFPAVLIALVVPALKDAALRIAAAVGAALAVGATPFLPAGVPVLLSLLALLVVLRSRWRRRGGDGSSGPGGPGVRPGSSAAGGGLDDLGDAHPFGPAGGLR